MTLHHKLHRTHSERNRSPRRCLWQGKEDSEILWKWSAAPPGKNDAVHQGKTSGRTASESAGPGLNEPFYQGKSGMHRMVPVLAGRKAYIWSSGYGQRGIWYRRALRHRLCSGNNFCGNRQSIKLVISKDIIQADGHCPALTVGFWIFLSYSNQ